MTTVYLRVFLDPTRRGCIEVQTLCDWMFDRLARHERQPVYELRLDEDMAGWSLDRLRDWYALGREFRTLPASNIAPPKPPATKPTREAIDAERAAERRRRQWCIGAYLAELRGPS